MRGGGREIKHLQGNSESFSWGKSDKTRALIHNAHSSLCLIPGFLDHSLHPEDQAKSIILGLQREFNRLSANFGGGYVEDGRPMSSFQNPQREGVIP